MAHKGHMLLRRRPRSAAVARPFARQPECERRTRFRACRFQPQSPAHGSKQLARYVQPKACTLATARPGAPAEPCEEATAVGFIDPRSVVGDRYPQSIVGVVRADEHLHAAV